MACIFGDVTKIDTSGASAETASQDNLNVLGVDASHKMAANDLSRMSRYKDIITKVGNDLEMDPAVICGIISRESRAGSVLEDGWCPNRYGFGLMQVDRRYYPEPEKTGEWNSEEHINQGTEILIGFIKKIQAKFPSWSKEQQFKGGISAYNAGPGNVQTYEGMDIGTQGEDYANDVVARAQWFKMNGF